MKKPLLLPLLIFTFLLGNISLLKAQCYGTVMLDQSSTGNGSNTFTITTTNPNELIMIAYDGWPSPGAGPITVDGNPATHIQTAFDGVNSGVAETYAYSAPAAGVHNIVCTEPPLFFSLYFKFRGFILCNRNLPFIYSQFNQHNGI